MDRADESVLDELIAELQVLDDYDRPCPRCGMPADYPGWSDDDD